MLRPLAIAVSAGLLLFAGAKKPALPPELEYTADGQMKFPEKYREWTFVTSGLGMSYTPGAIPEHPAFDNVFVSPSSYKAFLQTGAWPDKTVFILEIRGSETKVSIYQRGTSQATEVRAYEAHVKDSKLPGGWGFFEFGRSPTAKLTERSASCYSCHEEHGAVDTTFVQFYPTLIGVAKETKTLSAAYLKEMPHAASAGAAPTKY